MPPAATTRRFFDEVFSQGDLDLVDELFAADYVGHPSGPEQELRGPQGVKDYVGRLREGVPDLALTIEDQVADGDKIATRWTARGTHDGELLGAARPVARRPSPASRFSAWDPATRSSKGGRAGTCSGCSSSSASPLSPLRAEPAYARDVVAWSRAYAAKACSNSGHQSGSAGPGGRGDRGGGFRGPPPSWPPLPSPPLGSSVPDARRAASTAAATRTSAMNRAMAGGARADTSEPQT